MKVQMIPQMHLQMAKAAVRYAPSPTGRLHVGNFRTAVIAELWARYLKTELVFRYEDNDEIRSTSEFLRLQKQDFKDLGIHPDQECIQSKFKQRHFEVFLKAISKSLLYPCFSSRKEVAAGLENMASAPHQPVPIYDGQWRDRSDYPTTSTHPAVHQTVTWRFRNDPSDGSQDFIVARTAFLPSLWQKSEAKLQECDFVAAYNWACALDDFDLKPQLIVRAWDLDSVLEQQRALHAAFANLTGQVVPQVAVFHTSLITDNSGHRLEKRSPGVTLDAIVESGVSAADLRELLVQSFDASLLKGFAKGSAWGENLKARQLQLLP